MAVSPGRRIVCLPLGAIIQQFNVGGINIVQGFETADQYRSHNTPYFGETIGRVANRISDARIQNLNGRSYVLAANNGPNALHGGLKGWGQQLFEGPKALQRNGKPSTLFRYVSSDGEEGYPGAVEFLVYYTESEESRNGEAHVVLEIEYEARLVGDEDVEETVVAVTNHSYFNLGGGDTIDGTDIRLCTNKYLPLNDKNIPVGIIESLPSVTPNEDFTFGAEEPSFDHCFIVNEEPESVPVDTRDLPLTCLAELYHPNTQLHLQVYSTEPAFQLYTGEFIDVPAVGTMPARGPRSGLAIEPSRYVNAVNTERWKSMVILRRGQTYGSRIVYRVWSDARVESG